MPPWTFRETPAPGAVVLWTVGSAVVVPEEDSESVEVEVEVPEAVSVSDALDLVKVVPVALASVVLEVSAPSVLVAVAMVVFSAVVEGAEVVDSSAEAVETSPVPPPMVKTGVKL